MAARKRKKDPIALAETTKTQINQYLATDKTNEFFGIKELHYYTSILGWSVESIQETLLFHDQGQFKYSELLYNAMRKIPRIDGAMETRGQTIRTLPFSLPIKKGTPEPLIKAFKFLEENFDRVISPNDLVEVNERTNHFGFCVASIEKRLYGSYFFPCLTPFTHFYITYDQGLKRFRIWDDQNHEILIGKEDKRFCIFHLGGIRPWVKGKIRPLGTVMARMMHAYDRWLHYNDWEAEAKLIMKSPPQQREQADTQKAVQVMAALRGGDTAILPVGYEASYLSSGGRGQTYQSFLDMINECNNEIGIILLGNNMAQESKSTGSYAQARVGEGLNRDRIVGDLSNLVPTLQESVMRLFIQWNFTEGLYKSEEPLLSYTPKPTWHPEQDRTNDPQEMAITSKNHADALSSFMQTALQAGINLQELGIDWKEMGRKCGLALLENNIIQVKE